MKHTVFRSDKMHGTYNVGDLVNVKIHKDLDNGNIVKIEALAEGEREAYQAVVPTATTPLEQIVLIAEPEVMYDERLSNLSDFYNKSGAICRAYRLHHGDEFAVTKEAFDGTPNVSGDKIVEVGTTEKLKVVGEATLSSTQIGTIIAQEGEYFVIRVV